LVGRPSSNGSVDGRGLSPVGDRPRDGANRDASARHIKRRWPNVHPEEELKVKLEDTLGKEKTEDLKKKGKGLLDGFLGGKKK